MMRNNSQHYECATGRETARRLDTGLGGALDPLSFTSAQDDVREYDETVTIVQRIPNFDTLKHLYGCMEVAYNNREYFCINRGAVVLICGRMQQRLFFVDLTLASPSLDSTEQYTVLTKATGQPTRATRRKITDLQHCLMKHWQDSQQFIAGTVAPVRAVAVATDEDVGDLNRTTARPATSVEATAVPIGILDSDTAITDMHRADAEIAEAASAAGPLSSLTTPNNTPQKRKRGASQDQSRPQRVETANTLGTDDTLDTTSTITTRTEGKTFLEQQRDFLTQRNLFWNEQVQACTEKKKQLIDRVKRIQQMIQEEEQRHAKLKSQLDSMLKEAQQEQAASDHRSLTAETMVDEGSQRFRVITMEIDQNKRTRKTQSEKIANAQKQMQHKLQEQQRAMQTKLQEQQRAMQEEMKQTFMQFMN